MITGIYKLSNNTNGKIYIGSSIDIDFRWRQHRNAPSSLIGRALKKYSHEGFEWEVVEETTTELLLEREQYYLDTLQPFGDKGYNLATVAGNTLGVPCSDDTKQKISEANMGKFVGSNSVKAKTTTFMSPEGELVVFLSIGLGSRERGLHIARMAEVARGKRRHYRGWTCPDAPEWIPAPRCNHIVVSPDGIEYRMTNIKEFSLENNLNANSMRQVASERQKQHKGWRLKGQDVKTFILRDITGTEHTTFELKSFAENHGLSYTAIRSLACGNQKYHKGWTLVGKR